jgi:anti-anti-sigma factor
VPTVVSENPERNAPGVDIQVESQPVRAPAFAAIVKLCGEHDIATSEGIRDALAPISGHVLVNLSDCSFLDSTVLSAFVLDSRARSLRGHRLELAVPESNKRIVRTLQVSGLTEVLTVHATPTSRSRLLVPPAT